MVTVVPNSNDQDVLYNLCSWTIWRTIKEARSWNVNVGIEDGLWTIRDDRGAESTVFNTALTDTDRDLVTCPVPRFGEFEDLVPRLRAWLRHAGYGEIT